MNLLDAARQLVRGYPGRVDAMAQRLGKNPGTLRHEVAGAPTYKLGAEDLEEMTLLALEVRQPNALVAVATLAANCGQMLVPLPQLAADLDDDCMRQLTEAVKDFGQLCTEVSADLVDGRISDNELARIDADSSQLIARLGLLREALARRNREDKPPSTGEGSR